MPFGVPGRILGNGLALLLDLDPQALGFARDVVGGLSGNSAWKQSCGKSDQPCKREKTSDHERFQSTKPDGLDATFNLFESIPPQ